MMSFFSVVVWFVLVCCVDSEVAESPPASPLLDRIVALENRDYEQSKRIMLLEQRVILSEERVQHLTMANEDLIKHNTDQLTEQNAVTIKLQLEIQALRSAAEEKEQLILNLQSKFKNFDTKLEEQTERIKEIARKNSLDINFERQSSDDIPLNKIHPKPHKDDNSNNTDEPQARHEDESYQENKNTEKVSTELLSSNDGKLLPKLRTLERFAPQINNNAEQSAIIRLLEQRAEFSDKKLQEISTAYEELLSHVDKLNQKDDVIQQLQIEVKHLESLLGVQEKSNQEVNFKKQEPGVQEWNMRKNEKSLIKIGKIRQTDSRKHPESTTTNEASEPIIYSHTRQLQSSDLNVAPILKGQGAVSIPITNEKRQSSMDAVAFHAAFLAASLMHPDVGASIVFPDVTLNLGNGYHSSHGLFTAPRAGVYIFSASLMCNVREIHGSIVKNGQQLSRIYVHGEKDHSDQGSATAITHLNVGDEVWVRYDHPPNSEIWGNGFTVFTGVLVLAT